MNKLFLIIAFMILTAAGSSVMAESRYSDDMKVIYRLVSHNQYEGALNLWEASFSPDTDNGYAYLLGFYMTNDVQLATSMVNKAILLLPDSEAKAKATAYLARAYCFYYKGSYSSALTDALKAAQTSGAYEPEVAQLLQLLNQQSQLDVEGKISARSNGNPNSVWSRYQVELSINDAIDCSQTAENENQWSIVSVKHWRYKYLH